MSSTELCAYCGKLQPLDGGEYRENGFKCSECLDPVDPVEAFEADNERITKFIAKYCIKRNFNPAERSKFLQGVQIGVGLARAIQTDTVENFI